MQGRRNRRRRKRENTNPLVTAAVRRHQNLLCPSHPLEVKVFAPAQLMFDDLGRLGSTMSNSRLAFSALQEKFALVTSRNRWSMEMNFEWLRVGRPSNCFVRRTVAGRRCAATSAVVGDQGL